MTLILEIVSIASSDFIICGCIGCRL